MSDLTSSEKRKLERLFSMGGGYVLDFSNRTFSEFIEESVRRDIYDARYDYGSGSKAVPTNARLVFGGRRRGGRLLRWNGPACGAAARRTALRLKPQASSLKPQASNMRSAYGAQGLAVEEQPKPRRENFSSPRSFHNGR